MPDDFSGFHSDVMRTIRDELKDNFNSVAIGSDPNYGKMTYPAAQYVPDTSQHQQGTDFDDRHIIFYVFKEGKSGGDFIDKVETVEDSTDRILSALKGEEKVSDYKPTQFDYLLGEESGNMLYVIRVVWTTQKIFDW